LLVLLLDLFWVGVQLQQKLKRGVQRSNTVHTSAVHTVKVFAAVPGF
jgi:hypothetical protein